MTAEANTTRVEVLVVKETQKEAFALGLSFFLSDRMITDLSKIVSFYRYQHYVELVEPAERRACIKCCDNAADCPTNKDTQGCPTVIPGNYFNCD
jgi:hypothetical protein